MYVGHVAHIDDAENETWTPGHGTIQEFLEDEERSRTVGTKGRAKH
jgi:hypothetical protein